MMYEYDVRYITGHDYHGHDYHGHYLHSGCLSGNNYVRDLKLMSVNIKVRKIYRCILVCVFGIGDLQLADSCLKMIVS